MTDYKVALDVYNGPLDLLLFLIRREEVDIRDIPIAGILGQFLESVELIKELDPESVGDFLVLAATLMEIKSRMLLPTPPPEEDDNEIADPRLELVRQLLEYKKFKDAARALDRAAEEQARKHPRSPVIAPLPQDEVELDNLDIWNLFDAFNRILEQTGKRGEVRHIEIDDTPITLHADDILDSIDHAGGAQKFEEIFTGRQKSEMIGLFLALLELIRQHRIRVRQEKPFGTIWLHLVEKKSLDLRAIDDEEMTEASESGEAHPPRETGGQDSTAKGIDEGSDGDIETADVLCAAAAPEPTVDMIENNIDGGSDDETQ